MLFNLVETACQSAESIEHQLSGRFFKDIFHKTDHTTSYHLMLWQRALHHMVEVHLRSGSFQPATICGPRDDPGGLVCAHAQQARPI